MFVRVVHRQGWDVELVDREEKRNFASREDALGFAESLEPEWIEVGVVVPEREGRPQHHEWQTLRRRPGGGYAPSGLSWGGKGG